MDLIAQLESILFYKGTAVRFDALAEALQTDVETIQSSLGELQENLASRGIRLVMDEHAAELVTAPEAHELIQAMTRRDLTKRLGKAGLETLTIVVYHAPVARRDIDYIRGVNSSQVLRNLLIRGLIQKSEEHSGRDNLYEPTTDLLKYMGITHPAELPEYEEVRREIQQFYAQSEDN